MTNNRRGSTLALAVMVGAFCMVLLSCESDSPQEDLVEAGAAIFHDGVLPDGSPLVAMRPEGFTLEGEYAACATCHRRSGMGSVEGLVDSAILVPPLVGPVLFRPALYAESFLDESHYYVPHPSWRRAMTRPAYDKHTLAASLRDGLNSAGEPIGAPMPRYDLDDAAAQALTAYLRQLGSEASPGVTDEIMHIATVIAGDANPARAEAVLGVLNTWASTARGGGLPWQLHTWSLNGPADTWQAQLDSYYDKQPVFAVLSGAGASTWQPVHDFCEQSELPCIMPVVDLTPLDRAAHFSAYFSPGIGLEARILAKYLQDSGKVVRQRFGDDAGAHAAAILGEELGATTNNVEEIGIDDALVLWLRPDAVAAFVAEHPNGPPAAEIYLSALLASPEDVSLPPTWREHTRFVTLFDDLGLQGEIARLRLERWLTRNGLAEQGPRRVQADAYVASYILNKSLATIRRQELNRPAVPLTREHLLETLEDIVAKYSDGTQLIDEDLHIAYYGRMSLGPGQRIAARGGSIVGYQSPDSSRLILLSDRIVP